MSRRCGSELGSGGLLTSVGASFAVEELELSRETVDPLLNETVTARCSGHPKQVKKIEFLEVQIQIQSSKYATNEVWCHFPQYKLSF